MVASWESSDPLLAAIEVCGADVRIREDRLVAPDSSTIFVIKKKTIKFMHDNGYLR